ncbi:glycogen debranching N-terminal domain-containing protein [Pantanalinema rosaneae CENA516]|uniref:amylo-alpha-1,6-glucosidase n=1 Tax=Pantanalinema rosaneae TaxID=1620701 RepID=UPI003D6F834F
MQISVGPPVLTINHGRTFMVTDLSGNIDPTTGQQGIFTDDTRFLSYYACYVDGNSWKRLSSATTAYYASRIYLFNPTFSTNEREIAENELSLIISRVASQGIREELDLTNYGLQPVHFNLEIALRSDFADIFEVESQQVVRRGQVETRWIKEKRELRTLYTNGDYCRQFMYRVTDCDLQPCYGNGRIVFEITLEPGATWHACSHYILTDHQHTRKPLALSYQEAIANGLEDGQYQWQQTVTDLDSSQESVVQLYRQSIDDLGAMRLYDYDFAPNVWIPAAGVPKFVTLFGRDSLIISLQNMIVHPGFAKGCLQKLAELQATDYDDWQDAEPGKILHEIRMGELAQLGKIPHTPYYGAADTTSLFLITLHEVWKWSGDSSLLRDYRDVIDRCLTWIDQYGDFDGDGFQEYQMRSSAGIENQAWKDSGDSVVYPDGSQVKAPKTLCELQGYVFDAWMRMAEAFEVLGDGDRSQELHQKAARLQTQFEKQFWCEDTGFYAFALDPDKQPVATIASNPGHCLWSGIIRRDRAEQVAKRLLQPDMWSGWGIRTLSSTNPAYNPFSYHRGSVWPHDNSLIALGLKRYGLTTEVAQVAEGIFNAAQHFASYRIPELYSGVSRAVGAFPAPYQQANVPQGWAAASVFQLLQALLGLQADAPHGILQVDPVLPEWLPDVTLRNLKVGGACVDLTFWREGDRTCWDAVVRSGQIEITQQPWQPWINSLSQPILQQH